MAQNPVSSLMPKQETSIGSELNERVKMQRLGEQALGAGVANAGVANSVTNPGEKIHSQPAYGTGAGAKRGEKRIDTSGMTKPLGAPATPVAAAPKMHDGGTVPKTGQYTLKAGEKVLTPEQHGHLKSAMALAHTALSHEPDHDITPPKVVKDMKIRRSANGGHIVTHVHTHFEHPDEEHTTEGPDGLVNHVLHHMTDPDDEEMEADAGKAPIPESKGTAAAEEAVGLKK